MSTLALVYALGCALSWSLANVTIGPASRRVGAFSALVGVTFCGACTIALAALLIEGTPGRLGGRGWLLLCGGVGASLLSQGGLFLAFERGKVSVVAPIVAGWCVISLGVGLMLGERLSPIASLGVAFVVLGNSVLGAMGSGGEERSSGSGVWPALVSALGFGLMAPCLEGLGESVGRLWAPALLWGGLFVVGVPLLRLTGRPLRLPRGRADLAAIAAPSLFEAGGYVGLSLALGHGALSEVTPVSSLATGISVLLGVMLLRERLPRPALLGALVVSVGVVLVKL